uniref:Chorion peroxidase n=1 Tax=Enterobius vermicularis TaxID=51028 RepID=A0A0N4V619_ENTVE
LSEDEDFTEFPRIKQRKENFESLKSLISKEVLQKAVSDAMTDVEKVFNKTEKEMFNKRSLNVYQPVEISLSNFNPVSQYAKELSFSSLVAIESTQNLRKQGITSEVAIFELPQMELTGSQLAQICPITPVQECLPSKYRTVSGQCNNVYKPLQGAVYEPFQRFILPDYSDGISFPRRSVTGSLLPNARKISRDIITDNIQEHNVCSAMIPQWAMFVYEDLAQIGSNQLVKGEETKPFPCCAKDFSHPECYPIEVESGDPIYSTNCLPYTRSITSPRGNCSLGYREQGNGATSYLDASNIYGSTKQRADKLRAFKDGLMKSKIHPRQKESLPIEAGNSCGLFSAPNSVCFLTGSDMSTLTPGSTTFHILWLRHHNKMATQLKEINPHWDDERLYQETRAIVISQIQHITYSEFLPIIVGIDNLRRYGLNLRSYAYDSDYDLRADSSTLNEYASAAGLFFYSLFPNRQSLHETGGARRTRNNFHSSPNGLFNILNEGRIDMVLRSFLITPMRKFGLHMNEDFKNHFLRGQGKHGTDLAATIIQLGRDHGLPGYTTFRTNCGLRRPSNFSDLSDIVLDSVDVKALSELYESIDDVDLFILGLAEKPEPGSLVGPTFACIIGRQFQNTRHGDRYWYENFFTPSAFTLDQLNEIRRTTLARIICDNSDQVTSVQPNVFSLPDDFGNCLVDCNSTVIEEIDLKHWVDQESNIKLPITKATIEKALKLGAEHAEQLTEAERLRIESISRSSTPNLAVVTHSNLMAPKQQSLQISQMSAILREATKVLVRGEGLEKDERLPSELDFNTLQRFLPTIDIKKILGVISHSESNQDQCLPKPLPCDHTSKYRTYTGWCNNLKFPHYGNAFSPMRRLLDPVYDDGFDSPRMTARSGKKLPSARSISNAVHNDAPEVHVKYTHMLMQIGQLLDHDFAHSPISRGPGNTVLDCRRCDSPKTVSAHCFPIPVDRNDPHFKSTTGQPRCIPFTRSLLGQLNLGYRNQLDQLTSFIDASFLYGSTDCEVNSLRLFSQGKMNFTNLGFNAEALPQGSQERDCR